MQKLLNKLAVVAAAAALCAPAFAQELPKDADAPVTVKIEDVLTITNVAGLDFGTIAVTGVARSVEVPPAEGAIFTVSGTAGQEYTTNATAEPLTGPEGATMTITNFVILGNDSLSDEEDTLTVGATLNIAADQADGDYTGNLNVAVDYVGEAPPPPPEEEEDGLPIDPTDPELPPPPPFPPENPIGD